MTNEILDVGADCQITTVREFDAPIGLVFKAWTDSEHLSKWWGPKGFTNSFKEYDLKPGGKWIFTMHGSEKGNYENECVFIKIEKPRLIAWNRISKPIFQVVALFEERSMHKTKVTFKMLFDNAKECNKLKAFVLDKNEENFDKLEMELKQMMK